MKISEMQGMRLETCWDCFLGSLFNKLFLIEFFILCTFHVPQFRMDFYELNLVGLKKGFHVNLILNQNP